MAFSTEYGQEVITKLEEDSKWFKHLKAQQKLFVAEYCTNGFNAEQAASKVSNRDKASKFLEQPSINGAIEEFVDMVLSDRASKLEAKITDVLWKRAFYNPLDFIDEKGQPLTGDGSPYFPDDFDLTEYKRRLGEWAVVIEGITTQMHPRNPDMKAVTVKLADRNQALKQLSQYVGMAREETDASASSFVVNLNVNGEEKEQKHFKIVNYEDAVKRK